MIYVLYGTEETLINKFIEKIKNEKNITNIIKYDLEENSLDSVLEDASYLDLFESEKIIVVNNSLFLTSSDSIDTDNLERYLLNPNEKTILFFVVNFEKLDERKKIVKLIKEKYKVIEFNKIQRYDFEKYIKNSFEEEEYQIDNLSIKNIISNLGGNFKLIDNEIQKLKLYKINEKKINVQDVDLVITKVPEDNLFKLVDAVINNDKENMFKIYKNLINLGEEPIKIVIMLSNQFRLFYQVKILLKNKLNKSEISSKLSVHPYRVELAIERVNKYEEDKLINILESLADLDLEIKTSSVDKNRILEIFFLEL